MIDGLYYIYIFLDEYYMGICRDCLNICIYSCLGEEEEEGLVG